MTSIMMLLFSSSTTKRTKHLPNKKLFDSNAPLSTVTVTFFSSTILSSFSHNNSLKMLEKNNTTFKEDIKTSFKKEVATKLQLHKDTMMEKMNQCFTSLLTEILQTMKNLVINMVSQLSNQQRSNLLSSPSNDMIHTQPTTYPYYGVFLQHPYLPQRTPYYLLTHMYPPSYPDPSVHIPPQSSQRITLPSNQILPPPPQHSQISTNFTTQQSQTSFEHIMTELDAEL